MRSLNNKGALCYTQSRGEKVNRSRRLDFYNHPLPPAPLHHVSKHLGALP